MATMQKEKKEICVSNTNQVSFQVGGQTVELNQAAVRQLTNDNKFITDGEIELFINLCKYQKLNPFIREAYLVKYDDKKPAQMVTSLGAFMRIADEQSTYEGMEDGIIVQTSDKKIIDRVGCVLYPQEILLGGWAKVYRADRKFPAVARIELKEYSKGQSTWNNMPKTMINKCAKVSALRKAFPNAFEGMYEADEFEKEKENNSPAFENINTNNVYEIVQDEIVQDEIVDSITVSESQDISVQSENISVLAEDEVGIEYIPYSQYKNEKDLWDAVNYPNGEKAYNTETKTIRVRRK